MKYHIPGIRAGFLLDQLFGDPYFLPHPIRGIGWLDSEDRKDTASRQSTGQSDRERGRSADRENFWW